jgi:hypothetical protein
MPTAINGICSALSLVCVAFFIVGTIGYANTIDDLRKVAWFYADGSNTELYVGLQSIGVYGESDGFTIKFTSATQCIFNFCSTCEDNGKIAAVLTIIAAVLAAVVMSLSAVSAASFHPILQLVNGIVALASGAVSAGAVGLVVGPCMSQMSEDLSNFDFAWGPGAILTTIGTILAFSISILLFIGLSIGKRVNATVPLNRPRNRDRDEDLDRDF